MRVFSGEGGKIEKFLFCTLKSWHTVVYSVSSNDNRTVKIKKRENIAEK